MGRMMVALEHPTAGSVRFEDSVLTDLKGSDLRRRRRDVQLMFQDPYASLDPRMRVGTIIGEPLRVQKVGTRDEQRDRVAALLREVGLSPQAVERYPHEFSGGQRQRIGLARALALEPKLVVADEPVSALDVSIQAQILNLMKDLQRRHGLTYVMISHDLAVIRYMADTIGVMYLGKLVELGPSADVYTRPAHPYTQGLLDAVPAADRGHRKAASRRLTVRGELPSAVNPPSGCRFRTRCPRAQDLCAEVEPLLTNFGPEPRGRLPLPAADAGLHHQRLAAAAAGDAPDSAALQAHFEGVPQGVADEVEGDHHQDDAESGRVDLPPVAGDGVVDAVGEHGAPVGSGSGMPSPMKPRAASKRMESATWKVANTTMVPMELGTMCRPTMRAFEPPMTRTAWTYSRTRRVSVSPRTSRAGTSQLTNGDDDDDEDLGLAGRS